MSVLTKADIPEGFARTQAIARQIRETFPQFSNKEIGTAAILIAVENALENARMKMGDKMFNTLPGMVLACTVEESLLRSHLISDCAATVLVSQGRVIDLDPHSVANNAENVLGAVVAEGGVR